MQAHLVTAGRRWRIRALLSLCALVAAFGSAARAQSPQAAAPARALTVERIYGAPSLSGQVLSGTQWSPDGKWLSYLAGDEIWVIDASNGQRRVLVDADHLRNVLLPPASRGQQTGLGRITPPRYLWAPDGKAILLISAEQLFWYDLGNQSAKTLLPKPAASGEDSTIDDAKISPDGRWVSFVRAHDVWAVPVSGGAAVALTHGGTEERRNGELDWVYPEELDLHTAYWWSPDASQVAFLELDESHVEKYPLADLESPQGGLTEERYPRAGSPNPVARVGVVPLGSGGAPSSVTWMDTGTSDAALLARVDWLPDSRRLAIERLDRTQKQLDLLIADAANGKSHVAFAEKDPYWINLSDDLYFFADGKRFLWSSERSGFRHLYLYDVEGQQRAQLTRGDWEVESVEGVDERAGQIYFMSSEKSAIEQHLYRVALSGGEPVALTHDHGTHEVSVAPDFAHFFDTYSNATTPPRQDLAKTDGTLVATITANKVAELDGYHLQPGEMFTVPGADGTPLDAELIKPADFDPSRKYPVIVHLYGGPGSHEVADQWQGTMYLWHELMAQKGFVIFVLDNRGTSGRGHKFETAIYHHFGEAELADQLAGVAWLKKQAYVDPARIGIWGWSYGGYMTCMAMLRAGDVFKAGFAGAPVTDWLQYDTIYTERYMGTPQENPDGYRDSSPVTYAAGLKGKLLIIHATGDDNVHFSNTVELAEKFVDAQKYAEYQIYAGRGHGISDAPARIHIFNRVTQFFIENLAP
jgi:dipeptidyl-peptidase-4